MKYLIADRTNLYFTIVFVIINAVMFGVSHSLRHIWVSFDMLFYIYLREILGFQNSFLVQMFFLILLGVIVFFLLLSVKHKIIRWLLFLLLLFISVPILDLRGL